MLAIKKQNVLPRNSREKEAGWFTPDCGGAEPAGLACICLCTLYEDERLQRQYQYPIAAGRVEFVQTGCLEWLSIFVALDSNSCGDGS